MSGLNGPSEIVLPVFKSISAIYMYAFMHIVIYGLVIHIFFFFFFFLNTTLKPIGTARDAVVQLCYRYESFFFCFICDKKVWSFGPYTTKEWQVSLPADGGCSLWQPLPLETDRHSKKKVGHHESKQVLVLNCHILPKSSVFQVFLFFFLIRFVGF